MSSLSNNTPPLPTEAWKVLDGKLGPMSADDQMGSPNAYYQMSFRNNADIWVSTTDIFLQSHQHKSAAQKIRSLFLSIQGHAETAGIEPEIIQKTMDMIIALRNQLAEIGYEFTPLSREFSVEHYSFLLQKKIPVKQLGDEVDTILRICDQAEFCKQPQ